MEISKQYVLKLSCNDRPGIVAGISRCISDNHGNIIEAQHFEDHQSAHFFMRVVFNTDDIETTQLHLTRVFEQYDVRHELVPAGRVSRVLILVSKLDHCLYDLLYRWQKGSLKMDVVGVVSNHDTVRPIVENHGLVFDLLPISKENKAEQEQKLMEIIDTRRVDLVILARYMQVLSDQIATKLYGNVINIHHSFLPSFKGARPYHQAHHRGVKLIGATAHYVTSDVDEGPIIEQDVARVKHSDSPDDFVRIGRDTESRVLARAVAWHLEHRIYLADDKTVIFN